MQNTGIKEGEKKKRDSNLGGDVSEPGVLEPATAFSTWVRVDAHFDERLFNCFLQLEQVGSL